MVIFWLYLSVLINVDKNERLCFKNGLILGAIQVVMLFVLEQWVSIL